jgi:TIR domain
MPHDVIVSYSSADKPVADAICAKLEERAIRCWIAPRDILASEDYGEAIIVAIDSAKLMVLVFSSNANASPHVMREAERAVHDGIPILPFRIEDVQPNLSLQYYISAQHWLDALTPPLEQHIQKLAETVTLLLRKAAPLTKKSDEPGTSTESPVKSTEQQHSATDGKDRPRLLQNKMAIFTAIAIIAALLGAGLYASGLLMPNSSSLPSAFRASGYTTTLVGDKIVYENNIMGVKFSYPQSWLPNASSLYTRYYGLTPPKISVGDAKFISFYNTSKIPYFGQNDSATIINKVNWDIEFYKMNHTNFTIIQNVTPTTLGGRPAYTASFSYDYNSSGSAGQWVFKEVWTLKDDMLYGIIYDSHPTNYAASLEQLDQIIKSFEFV